MSISSVPQSPRLILHCHTPSLCPQRADVTQRRRAYRLSSVFIGHSCAKHGESLIFKKDCGMIATHHDYTRIRL